jgi:hypothetical protein
VRVFHFTSAKYALEAIRGRRLKIATLGEVNDPFEFHAANLGDKALRAAFVKAKEAFAKTRGLLCFSRSWQNPLLWSHYADKHSGLCLGFDVPDSNLRPVTYIRRRLPVDLSALTNATQLDPTMVESWIFTKYSHWKYEQEVRAFVALEERDPETNLYFFDFSDDLRLATVIAGALATVTRQDISDALGTYASEVDLLKARLAFRSFRVVRQQAARKWT